MKLRLLLILALSLLGSTATAEKPNGVKSANTTASLLSDAATVAPGDTIRVGLRLQPDKGWHTYWKNAGDSGFCPSVDWELPPGVTASALDWPVPRINAGPVTNFDYKGEVIHVATITVPKSFSGKSLTIKGAAGWLACNNQCVPGDANLTITIPVSKRTVPNAVGKALFNRRNMPESLPNGWSITAQTSKNIVTFTLKGADRLSTKTRIILENEGVLEPSAKQTWGKRGSDHVISIARGPEGVPKSLTGLLLSPDGSAHAFVTSPE